MNTSCCANGCAEDAKFLRLALRLARRGCGLTSPNPMVGAVLVKGTKIIGRGWHRQAGGPHAEIEALADAQKRGHSPRGATLYVTLEPCSTHGRTPPCTDAIVAAGIKRAVVGAIDPNPKHSGKGLAILRRAGIDAGGLGVPRSRGRAVVPHPDRLTAELQTLAAECARLNEAFNHWIVHRTPFVTVKAAMTLDGKIATAAGKSKWITGPKARAHGMKLRQGADAVLVGINTILADDPALTVRRQKAKGRRQKAEGRRQKESTLRRIVLDSMARTPLDAKVVRDAFAGLTTVVVSRRAPKRRVAELARHVNVLVAPHLSSKLKTHPSSVATRRRVENSKLNLRWLLRKLGSENVTRLLVEGGGEVNASFLLGGFAHRIAFFYAPKILGGRDARKAVAGDGVKRLGDVLQLHDLEWKRLGPDLLLTARVGTGRLPVAG